MKRDRVELTNSIKDVEKKSAAELKPLKLKGRKLAKEINRRKRERDEFIQKTASAGLSSIIQIDIGYSNYGRGGYGQSGLY